ncbi:MAG: hypothetical protein KDD62_15305 [Bdellovibrionales bacterium]|nr:hypothetical protein [Bdellovibrionales bacterium]
MNRSLFVAIGVAICFCGSLHAQSLKDRQRFQQWEQELQKEVASTNEKCGTNITASLDTASWSVIPAERQTYNMASHCDEGCLYAVEMLCKDDLGKEAVKSQIAKITCKAHADATPKVTVDKETKEMVCMFDASKLNFGDSIKEALENML